MNVYAELLADGSPYRVRKCYYITPLRPALVDQHEGLFIVHSRRPQGFSFPATLVYHPSRRDFHPSVSQFVIGYPGIFPLQVCQFFFRDDGVHKEAAGISHDFRVGQLAFADINDYFPDYRQRQFRVFVKFLADGSVV